MNNQISPALLHKHKEDDVLLSCPRRVVPACFISKSQHESQDERVIALESLYERQERFFELKTDLIVNRALGVSFSQVMAASRDDLTRAVPHQVLNQIRDAQPQASRQAVVFDDEAIEAFLAHHQIEPRSSSFLLINQADHYFFYRKPHEHVPGIMFIEAARQTVYYQLYNYSNYQLGKVTISLNEQNAKYYSYGELMYPMEVVVDHLTEGDINQPKKAHISTSFYQRGVLIARIESITPIIPLGRFERARNACLFESHESFKPIHHTSLVALLSVKPKANFELPQSVSLKEISLSHCVTSIPSDVMPDQVELTLVHAGKLCFGVNLTKEESFKGAIKWRFDELNYEAAEALKEMIKRAFFIVENEASMLKSHSASALELEA